MHTQRSDRRYDDAGRLESVRLDGQLVADPNYDAAGRLTTIAYPAGAGNAGNGTSLAPIGYDSFGRITDLHWLSPTAVALRRTEPPHVPVTGDIGPVVPR